MRLLYKRQSSTQTPSTGLRHPSFLWRKVPESGVRSVSSTLSGVFKFRSKQEPLVKVTFFSDSKTAVNKDYTVSLQSQMLVEKSNYLSSIDVAFQ